MTIQQRYAIRRLHSIVHFDPRFLPNELAADQMDDDFVVDLFDDMMNKIVSLQADIHEMKQLQRQIVDT
mgnify:CR=1 FL=1